MNLEDLYQHWVRSQEEDSGANIVYRPESFPFPLRRGGRKAISISSDHTFVERSSGFDDRNEHDQGQWSINGESVLLLTKTGVTERFRIVELSDTKLVVAAG